MLCVAALAMVACGDEEPVMTKPDVLTVKQNGEVVYTDNEVVWRVELAKIAPGEEQSYNLYMDGTRFVAAMPMLDMEAFGMTNNHTNPEDFFLYTTEALVPSIKGNPMPSHTLTNFRCEIEYDVVMKVSFTCIGYDVTYVKYI